MRCQQPFPVKLKGLLLLRDSEFFSLLLKFGLRDKLLTTRWESTCASNEITRHSTHSIKDPSLWKQQFKAVYVNKSTQSGKHDQLEILPAVGQFRSDFTNHHLMFPVTITNAVFFHFSHFQSHARDSTTRFVRRLVGRLVGRSHFTFFMILYLWPRCYCPNGLVTSNVAPANPHATSVAMYPAL